jgi:hypothetical protein
MLKCVRFGRRALALGALGALGCGGTFEPGGGSAGSAGNAQAGSGGAAQCSIPTACPAIGCGSGFVSVVHAGDCCPSCVPADAAGGNASAGSASGGDASGGTGAGGTSPSSGGAVNVPGPPLPTDHSEVASCAESASTNRAGVTVVVYGDGSAERTVGPQRNLPSGTSAVFAAGSPDVLAFLRDVMAVGDVSRIPIGNCAKSVSFGTRTTITAYGKTSGDVQCAAMPSAVEAALIHDCNQLLVE